LVNNKENAIHAIKNNLYVKGSIPIIAISKIDGSVQNFSSIMETARELEINRKTLTSILKEGKTNNYNYDFYYAK